MRGFVKPALGSPIRGFMKLPMTGLCFAKVSYGASLSLSGVPCENPLLGFVKPHGASQCGTSWSLLNVSSEFPIWSFVKALQRWLYFPTWSFTRPPQGTLQSLPVLCRDHWYFVKPLQVIYLSKANAVSRMRLVMIRLTSTLCISNIHFGGLVSPLTFI